MKKITAIALCFVLTFGLLAACRSKTPEETNSPTQSTTMPKETEATIPTTMPTMPTVLPETMPNDATGNTDATGGTGSSRNSPMPMR